MTPILSNTDGFSQVSADLDNFSQESASLDKFAPEHQGHIDTESERATHLTPRKINREQAQQQLDTLGYKGCDKVFLRAFYASTDPRKVGDYGRKETATSFDQLIAHATRFQNEGRGVYFVVNGGGQTNDDVTFGRAIFYEHDNLDKDAQIELWKTLGLPEPSFQVDTGGKSIHSYWVFDEPLAIDKWLPLQAQLLDFADADRTIKNASRVMRLAGAWHTSGNQSLIISNSGKRYKYEELREVIPEAKKPETKQSKAKQSEAKQSEAKQPEAKQPKLQLEKTSDKPNSYKEIEVPVPTPVPLECALGKKSKELLEGVSIERNNSMAALARDLLGTEAEFQSLGQTSSDDAYTLFVDACRNCSPGDGWDEKEWNKIWDYAQTQNPTASNSKASPDAVENCIKSWYWEHYWANNRTAKIKLSARQAADRARDIIRSESVELEMNLKLADLRQETAMSSYDFENNIVKPIKREEKVKVPKEDKGVTPQIIGDELAEDLRDQLLYSCTHKSWMKYDLEFPGVWSQVADDYVRHLIHNLCRARGVMPNDNFIKNVLGWLQRTLFELKWLECPSNEFLPFQDGILELENNKWHEHAPGFRLTWVLPRQYKGSAITAGWRKIEIWFNQATRGNQRMKNELIAFSAATLRGMSGLQKFLLGTGYGGTGKGTFTELVTMLVGEQNVWVGKLEDLTKQDKIAELQTKRLAIFDDQEKYTGNLSIFRSMTGGALISGRNLYERSVTFKFSGLALVTANLPCFPASALSWLKRRIIQHEFAYTPTKRNRNLVREFEPEISAFTKYLLSIPVSEIERILDPEDQSINSTFWEDRVRADPMAAWLNELVIHDADAKTAVGSDKNEWKDVTYTPTKSTLFGSYNHYCTGGGYSAKGKNNFSADLVELCREVLGWKDVTKERAMLGVVIKGLRLRTDTDFGIPTIDELVEQKNKNVDLNVDLGLHNVDPNVDLQSLPHKVYVDHVDLNSKLAEKKENTSANSNLETDSGTTSTSPDQVNTDADVVETLPPPTVYMVYTSHTQQDIQPSQGLHSGLHSGQHEPELEPPPTYSGAAEQVLIAPPELETAPTVPTPPTVPPITPSTGSSQSNLLLLQDYARRIGEALGYQSPATAKAIAEYIQESIVNQEITESELAEVAGIKNWQAFTALRNLTEDEQNLVEIVQQAIASNDAETAKSALSSLKEVCNSGAADRQKVWNSLAESERVAFKALVQ